MNTISPLWQTTKQSRSLTSPGRELAKRIRRGKMSLDELASLLGRVIEEAREEGRDDERQCQRIMERTKDLIVS